MKSFIALLVAFLGFTTQAYAAAFEIETPPGFAQGFFGQGPHRFVAAAGGVYEGEAVLGLATGPTAETALNQAYIDCVAQDSLACTVNLKVNPKGPCVVGEKIWLPSGKFKAIAANTHLELDKKVQQLKGTLIEGTFRSVCLPTSK